MNREEKVAVFNRVMGQPITDNHLSVDLKLRQLGIGLIFEELKELAVASGCPKTFFNLCFNEAKKGIIACSGQDSEENKDIEDIKNELSELDLYLSSRMPQDSDNIDQVEQIDGLVDVQYTLSWCVNVFGHRSRFEKAYNEVCASNNSKACKNLVEAEATVDYWEKKDGLPCHVEEIEGLFVVKNNLGKVKKSINYIPTNYKLLFPAVVQ